MEAVLKGCRAIRAALSQLSLRTVLAVHVLGNLDLTAARGDGRSRTESEAAVRQIVTLTDDLPVLHVYLPFEDGVAAVSFNRDCLTLPVNVDTTFATTDPGGDDYSTLDAPERVIPLGPIFQVELPYTALKASDDPEQKVMAVAPALYPEYRDFFEPTDPLGVEVRIRRADGSESVSLEEYVAGGVIIVYKGALDRAYGNNPPSVIRVSVQPVDYSGVLERRE